MTPVNLTLPMETNFPCARHALFLVAPSPPFARVSGVSPNCHLYTFSMRTSDGINKKNKKNKSII